MQGESQAKNSSPSSVDAQWAGRTLLHGTWFEASHLIVTYLASPDGTIYLHVAVWKDLANTRLIVKSPSRTSVHELDT